MISMLMLLTQLIDPDVQGNASLVNLISRAFGFNENDPDHKDYRALREDILTNGKESAQNKRDFSRLNSSAARDALAAGASAISRYAPTNPSERQSRVTNVLQDASKAAGVSPDLIVGLWGYESGFGRNLKSPTGAQGDFQFTRSTMVETIAQDGKTIAASLRAKGRSDEATLVETIQKQTQGMDGGQIKAFAANARNHTAIDALRNSPEISTYAAAFYSKTVARQLKVSANDEKSFGIIYAGYNIGVGNALEIKSGRVATGWEVDANRGVAGKGNAHGQLLSYNNAMASSINSPAGRLFRARSLETPTVSGSGVHYAEAEAGTNSPQSTATSFAASANAEPSPKKVAALEKGFIGWGAQQEVPVLSLST